MDPLRLALKMSPEFFMDKIYNKVPNFSLSSPSLFPSLSTPSLNLAHQSREATVGVIVESPLKHENEETFINFVHVT